MSAASERLGFIFVRVPRTGSSTFMHYLTQTFGDQVIDKGEQHASAIELRGLWRDKWDRFYTFGFIRNPWEWLVSMYNANLSHGARGKEVLPGGPAGEMRRANVEFEDWLQQRRTTCIDWMTDERGEVIVDEIRLFETFISGAAVKHSAKDHKPYRDWYTPETAEYVAQKCAREIEIGNYQF